MLKALNISKKFGKINVLNNINLEVKKGSIVSIYGKSGAITPVSFFRLFY